MFHLRDRMISLWETRDQGSVPIVGDIAVAYPRSELDVADTVIDASSLERRSRNRKPRQWFCKKQKNEYQDDFLEDVEVPVQ